MDTPFEISLYHPRWVSQVVRLLGYLWGEDAEANRHYFKWKYADNPHTEAPLGIVAVIRGRVVGFRGYFATRYEIPGYGDNFRVLIPGDTIVHPGYRRKGLSLMMGRLAGREFSRDYRIMLNTTSTTQSLPGYLRLGFYPVAQKVFWSHYRITGLLRYVLKYNDRPSVAPGRVPFGEAGGIQVADRPRPADMASVIDRERSGDKKLRLFQDRAFFQWRYLNKKKCYVFYYDQNEGETTGYLVMGLSPNLLRGYIIDYGDSSGESVERILKFIIRHNHFDILSIYRHCLAGSLPSIFGRLGFKADSMVRKIENRKDGEMPLLVRPVRKEFAEADFMIHGLDIRNIDNWQLKGVCSDDA